MKILITGGHLAPALSIIEEIGDRAQIVFVGRKFANDYEKTPTLEYHEVSKRKIVFYHLKTGRLTRLVTVRSLINFLKFPLGFWQSYRILKTEKPTTILSFGGYIAFPICILGYFFRIPIFIHEQTIKPGLANRMIGLMAKQVFISFPETQNYFSKTKTTLCGNPVRKKILTVDKIPFQIQKHKQVIYITGGSIGSHSINLHIENIIVRLLEKYIVIHQTGNVKEFNDYGRLQLIKSKLTKDLRQNYYLKEHLFEEELGYIYSVADLVVARSGANTIFELMALKKPAVLIPLPWSAHQEQEKHAELFLKAGTAEIFYQREKSEKLLDLINKVTSNLNFYRTNFTNLENLYKENAAKIIIKAIL